MRATMMWGLSALLLGTVAPGIARAAQGRPCIPINQIRTETALNHTELVFHMNGGAAFDSHLPVPCDDLLAINSFADLKLKPRGIDLCDGDEVEMIRHGGMLGALGIGGDGGGGKIACKLGRFEPISEVELPESLRR